MISESFFKAVFLRVKLLDFSGHRKQRSHFYDTYSQTEVQKRRTKSLKPAEDCAETESSLFHRGLLSPQPLFANIDLFPRTGKCRNDLLERSIEQLSY